MPITFDTLDELKAFYRNFRLTETDQNGHAKQQEAEALQEPEEVSSPPEKKKPGRRPAAELMSVVEKPATTKRGPKPKIENAPKTKREKGNTLTAKIQESIRKFLSSKKSFTANDVYADLAKKDDQINKQSVITSVLKQMNHTFAEVSVTERPGNGPRPVKLYNA